MSLSITPQVVSIAKAGSTALNGAVTLTGGTNITLTQSGQDISIASSASGMSIGGTVTSGTTGSVLFVGSGPVLAQDNANFFWDDTNNRFCVGTNSGTLISLTGVLTIVNEASNSYNLMLPTSDTNNAPNIGLFRSKGTFASKTSVANGDVLGQITFHGYNSTDGDYNEAALIQVFADGVTGSADMPGRMVFYTTPDGSANPSEALRISNDQSARFSKQIIVGSTSAPTAQQDIIVGSSSRIGQIIKGAASQSVDFLQFQNSSGSVQTNITSLGEIGFNQTAFTTSANITSLSTSTATITVGANIGVRAFLAQNTYKFTSGQGVLGGASFFWHNNTYINDTSLSTNIGGNHFIFYNNATVTADTNTLAFATVNGHGFFDSMTFNRVNSGTLNVTEWNSFTAGGTNNTGVTITNRRGLWVKNMAGGTITTSTGIELDDVTTGTTKIALRVKGTTGHSRHQPTISFGADAASTAQVDINCGSSTTIGLIVKAAASQSANLQEWQDSSANILTRINSSGDLQYLQSARTVSANTAFIDSSTATITVSAAANLFMFRARNTFNLTTGHTIFNFDNFFLHNNTYKNDPSLTGSIAAQFNAFANLPTFTGDTNATTMGEGQARGFYDNPTFSRTNSGTLTVTAWSGFVAGGTNGTGVTITDRRGLYINNMSGGTITTQTAIEIDDISTGTTKIAIRQKGTTAHNRFQADTSFAQDSAPGAAIDVAGKLFITSAGLVTKYNNITTVSGGVPSELATVDLATQAAAIAATTLYTPAATGLFRISIYLQVTRAATTSSILGGATGVVITFNDGDGNVAQSNTAALATTAGAIAITAAGNTTGTNLEGTMTIYARTGVAIQYAIGYTSVGGTTMQYAAHLKIEAL